MEIKKANDHGVAVIGAGIAGIASAIRLAAKGYKVEVYEANSYPGGKLSEIQGKGYRFDAGPSLFTLPELVDDLFKLCGKNPQEFFAYQKLTVLCKYFYEDSTILTAYAEREKFKEEIRDKLGISPGVLDSFLDQSRFLYNTLADLFMKKSLHKVGTFLSSKALSAYLQIPRLNFFKSMNKANEKHFSDPRLVQLFNRYATYNGSDPYQTPATMNIIPHLEYNIGAYFPSGGMYAITMALVKLAEDMGVKFNFNAKVERILVENGKVKGIKVSGKDLLYSQVINNMDVANAYQRLLPDEKAPTRIINQPKSSSALIFYWGIKKEFPHLDLHNIFFSKDYRKEFEEIFRKKTISDDPTVYVNTSSKYNRSDAPDGCENWFVMINTPNNTGQDWDTLINSSRKNILSKLSRLLNQPLEPLIEFEAILDPRTIESRTSSSQGALYGNASNNKFAAFLRHANFSSKIKGLYFCGGSVHPGGGIPLSLLSAKIVSDLIPAKS